jgi:hypothetical protein
MEAFNFHTYQFWTFGFHKTRGISSPTYRLPASQEEIYSMEEEVIVAYVKVKIRRVKRMRKTTYCLKILRVSLRSNLILDVGTRWGEWSESRPGRAVYPGKGPTAHIAQEAGWTPEAVWTQRLEEKSSASATDPNPIARSSSP